MSCADWMDATSSFTKQETEGGAWLTYVQKKLNILEPFARVFLFQALLLSNDSSTMFVLTFGIT